MSFLLDESLEGRILRTLRAAGLRVAAVIEESPGASDAAILERAIRRSEVLLTGDKGIAGLVLLGKKTPPGVVLLRMRALSTRIRARRMLEVLTSNRRWLNQLTVIEPDKIRRRPLG